MPGILVATGFVRIDADTKPAMKALQSLGSIGGNLLATAIGPASAAVVTAVGAVASAAAVAGAAVTAYGAAVGQQFSQVKEAMTKQKTAEDAATKSTNAKTLAEQLAREGGFKYGQQVEITADMTDAARLRAENYNKALSASRSAAMAAKQSQQAYKTELGQMPKPTQQLAEALQNLKDDTKSWSDSLASSTMPVFTKGIQFLDRLLPKLSPVVRDVAHEVDAFSATLGEGTAGKVFREFGSNVRANGAGALRTFLDVARNLIVGVGGILNAFLPMSAGVTGGLEEMTAKFAAWGAGLGGSDGFGRFTALARETGPRLIELFRSLGSAFLDVASAAGPMSGIGLTLLTILAQLVDAIPTPVLRALVPVVLAVNTGMKLYALYQSIATAATWAFSTSVTTSDGVVHASRLSLLLYRIQIMATAVSMYATTTATWAWSVATRAATLVMTGLRYALALVRLAAVMTAAGFRILAVAMISNPIGLVVLALVALGAIFFVAWKKSETFRNIVKAALNGVKDVAMAVGRWFAGPFVDFFTKTIPAAFRWVLDWVKANWPWLLGALTGPVGLAVVWIVKHWDGVKSVFKAAWDFIYKWTVQPWVVFFGTTLPGAVRTARDRAVGFFTGLRNGLRAVWDWIYRNIVRPNVVTWTQTVPNAFRSLKNRVLGFFGGMRDGLSGIWSSVRRNTLGSMQSFFTKSVPGWASTMKGKVTGFFGSMRDGIGRTWDGIRGKTKSPINWVLDKVWNRGIYPIWGKIAGWIGIKNTLGKIKLLASGGTVGNEPAGVFNRPTAIVGEGNPAHPEYVIPTDPKYRTRALGLWRAAGAHFMESGGILGSIGDWLGDAASTVGNTVKGAAGFLADPFGKAKKLLNGSLKGLGALGTSAWSAMVKWLPTAAVKGLLKAVKDNVASLFGSSGGSGVQRWAGVTRMVLKMVGQPESLLGITLRRMNQESGGNPNIVNKWDSNWEAGHPSVGLMQVIGPTFRAHAGKFRNTGPFLYGVSVNPAANIYSSMRYALAAYGSLASAYGRPGGYATGTDGATAGWHWVGEMGRELMKLPAGTRIRSARTSARETTAGPAVIHLTVENHGVIGSRREVEDWLVGTLERLRTQRRLPRALGGAA